MITKEIKVNNKNAYVIYTGGPNTPERKDSFNDMLPPEIAEYVAQIGNFIRENAQAAYDQESNQVKMEFDSAPIEPEQGEEVKFEEPIIGMDYSNVPIPLIEDTDIIDFKKVDRAHAFYIIDCCENMSSLKQAILMNFDHAIKATSEMGVKKEAKGVVGGYAA